MATANAMATTKKKDATDNGAVLFAATVCKWGGAQWRHVILFDMSCYVLLFLCASLFLLSYVYKNTY